MKLLRHALLVAFTLSTTACNVEPELAGSESGALDVQSQAATTSPPLYNYCPSSIPAAPPAQPNGPTPLSSIPAGTPLYAFATNLRSAYTVVVTDPADRNQFQAFGFDVVSRTLKFHVSGLKSRGELRRLNQQIAVDIEALEQSSGIDMGFTWGSSGQVGGPLIPRPGGVHEGAWKVAFNNHFQLDEYLVSQPIILQ
ncbi:RodZ family helix-turn-helix domain-containing protein [Pyxidicoccus xibeiensis]|uniref:hypothetical protein n=1 Tax=Pyxidicoccus xibeiensis TaxID=2906759 RepID=UPI0020A8250A|nr:hypothetical protein [Pyxidicoccus xibeiensis]MCP3136196.1 hypothetical protein [Pyxidicoccus xibeiensis]